MTDSSVEESNLSLDNSKEINNDIENENLDENRDKNEDNNSSTSVELGNDTVELTEETEEDIEAPPPPPPPKMPENTIWEACWDENSKNYYFWNTETDEVTWDNPFEGMNDKNNDNESEELKKENINESENESENENNKKNENDDIIDKNNTNKIENDDSENYEIEVEGYEEALAEQQKKEQEEKEKENEQQNQSNNNYNNNNKELENPAATVGSTTVPTTDPAYAAYTNPTNSNYYGYGSYDYSQYYYNQYGYSQYPEAYSTATTEADKDTLSNFDSLLNKIDDAKEKLDDLSGVTPDNDKTDVKEEKKKSEENIKKEETNAKDINAYSAESTWAVTDTPNYWNYNSYGYPTPDGSTGQFQEYSVTGYFNKRTGRFQNTTNEMMNNPQDYFTPESKGERQMQYYFNPEAYQQQYNMTNHDTNDSEGGKRKLTRKEIEHFKKMKKRKRDEKLKRKYMD